MAIRPKSSTSCETTKRAFAVRPCASLVSTPTAICRARTALMLLKAKLYRIEQQKRRAEVEKLYDEKGEVAWGSQIRNYVMQPYTLVKDVRTGTSTSQVQNVLDGDLDEFMQAYLRQKQRK